MASTMTVTSTTKRPVPVTDKDLDLDPPEKKRKDIDLTFSDVQFKFLLRDEDTISKGLEQFIEVANAYNEGVASNDVVEALCKSSPDCADLLVLLDVTQRKLKTTQITQVFECVRHILSRIRTDLENFSATGEMIVQRILAAHMAQIYNSLRDQNKSNTVKATIQLLIAIVMLNDKSKKTVQARFNFDHHVFPTLFARRNRKDQEDIRSCLVLLTMAFVLEGDRQVVNTLVQQKTFLQLTISGLKYDSREVVTDVLATLLDKVIRGSGISKTLKIKLFSEKVLKQLCGLYKWEGPRGWSKDGGGRKQENKEGRLMEQEGFKEEREMVAATVHEFLCELCCSQKYGLMFFDKSFGGGKRNQNQILTHLLEFLSSTMDEPLKRDLMLKIVTSCPDQVEHFLPHLDKYLTPRWSEKWKIYMDFLTEVYQKLATVPSFLYSPNLYSKDTQTLVSMASTFCLPPAKLSPMLNLAIKHEDLRVRHHCLLLVQVLLRKSEAIANAFHSSKALGMLSPRESLALAFSMAVTKALPAPSAVFHCVEKMLESMQQSREKEKTKQQDIGFASHLLVIVQVLNQYQGLLPSLLSDRPKDVVRLIEAVGKFQTFTGRQQEERVEDDEKMDVDGGGDDDNEELETKTPPAHPLSGESSLAQIYLLKLLSNTDSREISLGREGLLEKLLWSAHQNVRGKHEGQIISLVCKMLSGMDAFANHRKELWVWISWALRLESSQAMPESLSAPSPGRLKSAGKQKEEEEEKEGKEGMDATGPPSSSFSCIAFLSRCLATLINDPVPYLDRVTEAVVDSTSSLSSDQDAESSSAGTNEGVIDAILLTEDEELDQLVSNSSLKLDASSVPVNEAPMSPLTIIALDNLQYSKTDCPAMTQYISTVLVHMLHSQTDPAVFSTAVKKSTGRLWSGVREYLEGWSSSKKKRVPSLHYKISDEICFPLSLEFMKWMSASPADTKKEAKKMQTLVSALPTLSFLEKSAFLDQALFYLTQSTKWTGLDIKERKQLMKFLQAVTHTVFTNIIANITTEEDCIAKLGRFADDVHGHDDLMKTQDQEISDHGEDQEKLCGVVNSILGHPVLSNLFLTQPSSEASASPKKSVLALSKTVSEFICKILIECKEFHLNSLSSLLLSEYTANAVCGLKHKQDVDVCMNCLEAVSCHMDLVALTKCLSDVLQSSLDVFTTTGDAQDERDEKASHLSKAGQVFLSMLTRWLGLIESMSSKTDSFLFPWSCDQSTPAAGNAASESTPTLAPPADSDVSLEEKQMVPVSGRKQFLPDLDVSFHLDVAKLTPLFDLLLHCSDAKLTSEICHLVSLVPSASSACRGQVFRHLIDRSLLCSKSQERLIRLLMSHNKDFYAPCGDYLSKNVKTLMKKGKWWLFVAYLPGRKYDKEREKLKQSICQGVESLIKKEANSRDEELWEFLTLLVSSDFGSDVTLRHFLYDTVYTFASDSPASATKSHFDLLYCVVSTVEHTGNDRDSGDSQTKGSKGRKPSSQTSDRDLLGNSFLDFVLQHFMFLLSKKTNRCTDLEAKLLDLGKRAMSQGKLPTVGFVSSSWPSFVKTTLKVSYADSNLLGLLADLVPVVYSELSENVSGSRGGKLNAALDAKSMFQLCISHTAFLSTLLSDSLVSSKAELVRLLHSLSMVDSECLEEKIGKVFMSAYTASLSQTDQRLLQMMQGFVRAAEAKEEIPVLWGKASLEHRSMSQSLGPSLDREASVKTFLDQIDLVRMGKTVLHFPQRRNCEDFTVLDASHFTSCSESYDPNYLLRVFIQILSPDKIIPIHSFVAKDCLGFLLVSLTSHHTRNRLMAYRALNEFYGHLDGSRCSEKQELAYILDLINASRAKDNQRLSFVVALFLARVVKLMLYPSDHMYITVLKFLTAKPEMDLANVPEFYKLFFSAESHFRQERSWILSLLRDGIRDSADYWLYQKKVIFRIIMAFLNSTMGDETSQGLVLETVKNACQQKATCVDLVKEHSLMSWLVMSVNQLGKRPYLVDTFCDLIHTIWFSLSSKVSFDNSTEKRNVSSQKSALVDATDKRNVDKNDEDLAKGTTKKQVVDESHGDDEHTSESDDDEESDTVESGAVSDKGERRRPRKKTLMVPKSTIVEMGLVIKSLVWRLNSASASGVLKVLQVVESLKKAGSGTRLHEPLRKPTHLQPEGENEVKEPSAVVPQRRMSSTSSSHIDNTSSSQLSLPHLFRLSPVESQVVIYFTARNVGDKVSMARSSAILRHFKISIEALHGKVTKYGGSSVQTGIKETSSSLSTPHREREVMKDEEEEAEGREEKATTNIDEAEVDLEKEVDEDGNGHGNRSEIKDTVDPGCLKSALEAALS